MLIINDKLIQNRNSALTSHADTICDKFILNIDNNSTKNCEGGSLTSTVDNSRRLLTSAVEDNTRRSSSTLAVKDNTRRLSSTSIIDNNNSRGRSSIRK